MNRIFKIFVATLLVALSVLALFACAPVSNIPEDLDLSGVKLNDGAFYYDGAEHSLHVEGRLPENVTVVYDGNSKTEIGTYTVTAKFYYAGEYVVGKDISATLKIKALSELATPTVGFFDKTVDYDGKAHSILFEGNLPEGITVDYVGNGKTDAGSYAVEAKFYYKGIYLTGRDLHAELTINKKSLDSAVYELAFNSTTVVYDGKAHSIFISGNIPDAIDVEYDGNGVSAVGEHPVKATLSLNNQNYTLTTTELTATIKIVELGIKVPDDLDLSGITLAGKTVTYDGEAHSLEISGALPDDVTVEYVGNGRSAAGSYSVIAKFYYKGLYIEGEDLTADLVIGKRSVALDGISFNSATIRYDGKAHSIAIIGTLPEGVTPIYEGNGVTDVGTHTVTVSFVTDGNHEPIDTVLTATIEIFAQTPTGMGVEFEDGEFVYDGKEHSLAIKGEENLLLSGITLIGYDGNGKVDAGEYEVVAKFAVGGKYEPLLDMKATLTIKPAEIKVSAPHTEFEFAFDGKNKLPDALVWDGEKPLDVTVVTVGGAERLVGTYTITYKFVVQNEKNYIAKEDITVTMTILYDPTFATEGIIYGANSDGTYYVKGYEGTATEVVIPETYNGGEVTTIAFGAFDGNKNITYVHVPTTVVAIGQGAFRGCTSLEAITLPFVGGSHNSSNEYFGYIFGATGYVGNEQFVPASLKVVELVGARRVPAYSFWGCTSLVEVRIEDGTEIGVSAFRGCTALRKVFIAESVVTVQGAAAVNSPFWGCSTELVVTLEAAAVPEGFTSTWLAVDSDGENKVQLVLGK